MKKINPTTTKEWNNLKKDYCSIKNKRLIDFFNEAKKVNRFNEFSLKSNDLFLDFSKNHITGKILNNLIKLAESCELNDAIDKMFAGYKINETENRRVLHTFLRNPKKNNFIIDNKDISKDVNSLFKKIKIFSESIIDGQWRGFTNKKITDIVNIGIGGSYLGPSVVLDSLNFYKTNLNIHFISNIDAANFIKISKNLNPETTLFIISSKTFETDETIVNAKTAKNWIINFFKNKNSISKHFIAISANKKLAETFGINKHNIFEFWDWVGGRYSMWGAIGLTISLGIGFENFVLFLQGAHKIDLHFKNSNFNQNIPVILGLIGIWYINFFNYNNHIIAPYDHYLRNIPNYIQQLDMESNGKYTDRNGNIITTYKTGPIVFGGEGTDIQHSFFQSMHQGTNNFTIDFISSLTSLHGLKNHHDKLFCNFVAQSQALAFGDGQNNTTISRNKFTFIVGNRPNNSIVFNKLTPFVLGQIMSMYEHKIFVQGVIWNIFSFDQWGVQLGKKISTNIYKKLQNNIEFQNCYDVSTNGLINMYKNTIV